MDRFADHKLPLSAERSNVYWESDLSEYDLAMLDEPSRPSSLLGAAHRAAESSAPGADLVPTVASPLTRRSAASENCAAEPTPSQES